jgi:ribosomal-protein-alanine N-acetyltransferase
MLDLTEVLAEFPVLETERLRLRQVTPADTPDMLRLMGDPRVTRFLGRAPFTTTEEAAGRVQMFENEFKERKGLGWGITLRTDGQFIGICRYTRIDAYHSRAEIGYLLRPEWWGQGVMAEAVGAALRFGFERVGLHSVEATIDPDNRQSRRLLEKVGFVQEGHFRESFYIQHEDRYSDSAAFSILRATWAGRIKVA